MLGAVALAAMILRGLVPAGYMLAAPAHAGELISVQICHGSGFGNSTLYLDPETGKYVDPDDLPGEPDIDPGAACPFALSTQITLPDLQVSLAPALMPEHPERVSITEVVPGRGLAAPPPPSRAPPLSA